jgi:hypothetical protein
MGRVAEPDLDGRDIDGSLVDDLAFVETRGHGAEPAVWGPNDRRTSPGSSDPPRLVVNTKPFSRQRAPAPEPVISLTVPLLAERFNGGIGEPQGPA